MGTYRPGERVLKSGVYRVFHDAHRLMHEATLRAEDIFPCCKQCGRQVRFELVRPVKDQDVLPFRTGPILEEWQSLAQAHNHAG